MDTSSGNIVYVIGAGFSAGLGFPTINSLLPNIWPRLQRAGTAAELCDIIRFHHPDFDPDKADTFVNVERLLSEMKANEQLFEYSRPASGGFTKEELTARRQRFLLEMAKWFHGLKEDAIRSPPIWLTALAEQIKREKAQIISFNWDLVLDELLFGSTLDRRDYGFGARKPGPRLIKPHGSLNWFEYSTGRHLNADKKVLLTGEGERAIYAFKPYRAPHSTRREYMPLIIPPVFNKEFAGRHFQTLWRKSVSILSSASDVRFLGYSLADADFHARFILRCGFYNQEHGA
ncbi:hypothetical protein JVX98_27085 [Ensifer sp. PDNC004]|uniref:hypothetical protein n=1 Tax=Ensifer sp. PDNC004 TaxID=2811423 RepID=UPI001964BEFB|nr:hypothetical protein [Ensifer sp. PDNC004]QRY67966.1 hypothetical protein JVX98_27085 [Ensifer sp. PDNC004]